MAASYDGMGIGIGSPALNVPSTTWDQQSEMLRQLTQANLQLAQQAPPSKQSIIMPLPERAREMFLKRLGGLRAEYNVQVSEFVQCHVHADMVYVFYFLKGREGVTKEPIDMFPSDGLIAQFRMVLV